MSGKQIPSFPLKLQIKSKKHLSLHLNFPPEALEYFIKNKTKNVKELKLKQMKEGKPKERTVYNPSREYKKLLRAINSKFLRKSSLPEGVLGGVIGKSIDDMANVHCGQEAVLSIDLKDFFPSIESGRVVNFLRRAGCSPEITGILTDLVTLNGSLPQGFPTSTMLANLIAYELDMQHLSQSKKYNGLRRTRWIDDIVFSGRSKDLTRRINSLLGAIKPHGFRLNNRKTEYKIRSNNPVVVGLDVSGQYPRVPIVVIEKVSEILYECVASGIETVQTAYESNSFGKKKDLKSSLEGQIKHIARFNQKEGDELFEVLNSIDWNH